MTEETTHTSTTNHGRRRPNVLITGTPGVGKTATAESMAETLDDVKHVNIGELIRLHQLYDGRDAELDTNILDEDKLIDLLEPIFEEAEQEGIGIVADFHVCEIFPERWFDLVLVLRCSTEVLFDRLTARGYSDKKRSENMESEIMQVILQEARESYDPNIVHEVPSNTLEDIRNNVQRVAEWTKQWIADHVESSLKKNIG
jgi:adenylate kinase